MMEQLRATEQEVARKKAEAEQDMMMASMVRAHPTNAVLVPARASCECAHVCCASGF